LLANLYFLVQVNQCSTCFLLGEINMKHSALAIRIIKDSTLN